MQEENDQIVTFTENFFSNLKCQLSWDNSVLKVTHVPSDFEQFYGKKSPYLLTFKQGVDDSAELDWGGGFRTAVTNQTIDLGDGTSQTVQRIVTPGSLISQHIEQLIGTGLRQSENADEIDEIVSALMSNLGTQVLTDLQGLYGVSQSFNGAPGYLDKLTSDSAQRTRDNFLNAGLATVQNAATYETNYRTARLGAAQTLLTSENQLLR
jgi:hypothetical protein